MLAESCKNLLTMPTSVRHWFMKEQKKDVSSEILEKLRGSPTEIPIRVERAVAKRFLMNNQSLTCGGTVFYLGVRNIGLGVCEVWKANHTQRNTILVK